MSQTDRFRAEGSGEMRHPCILIVDDDQATVELLSAHLEAEGWEIIAVTDGAQAIQIIKREPPNLMILDVTIPRIDDLRSAARIYEWSRMPIIALGARHEVRDKVKYLNLGADDYIGYSRKKAYFP